MLLTPGRARAEDIWLSTLDLSGVEQDWGQAQADHSVDHHDLKIGGKTFAHGIGTHANSTIEIDIDGRAARISGAAGVDDETGGKGSVVFDIVADGREVWNSGLRRGNETAKDFSLDLSGVKHVTLEVGDGGDGINFDHADWGDLKMEMIQGAPRLRSLPPEEAVILTPKESPKPRINGARVFGVHPGAPFLYTIAATGERPMTFSARHLPTGLTLDKETGRITGTIQQAGEYVVTLRAQNRLGRAESPLKIEAGETIGLTPAMGWNSWNCFASAVSEDKVKAAADAMVASGLINHGWTYINIDDFWQVHHDSSDPTLQGPHRDAEGRILPNPRFPDMPGLAEYVHARGLRIGLYSSPGPWTCGGCVASFDHELLDAQRYADWGFDYLKYDWCSYNPGLESKRKLSKDFAASVKDWSASEPRNIAEFIRPYAVMRAALDQQRRDILFSYCQYGMGDVWKWGEKTGGNSWRTTGDIVDTWSSMSHIGFGQAGHEAYAGPGHFNDPDMLVVGKVGWGPNLHRTHLTPNEQYTHISLWCLLTAPLLIGCDMTQFDAFTLNLLSNDEVLAVDQDPLGRQASRVAQVGKLEVWAKEMADGSKVAGLFNRGSVEARVTAKWSELGLDGPKVVRDLWRQQDLGKFDNEFSATVPRHGVVLVKFAATR